MPWQELSPMNLRMQFVVEWETGAWTMTELCAQYRLSRKTGYKWIERYVTSGPQGLHDQSRRPHELARAFDPSLVRTFTRLRRKHPRWGATKLIELAVGEGYARDALPARSTVNDWLTAHGLTAIRRRRQRPPLRATSPFAPVTDPNDVWTVDFKGEFRTRDHVYCYPLTLRDALSRYSLRCDALTERTHEATQRRFARAFARYGLPWRIRSDNGGPFASPALAGLSRLSIWWMRLGITPERIAPGHPEQNGSHEQFHAVLKAATTRPPAVHAAAQQRRFNRFCREYNEVRPHEALHNRVPASRYQGSPRTLPARLPPVEYDGHLEVRRVASNGSVSWRNSFVFVATPLAGEDVGFEEVDDGVWTVWFSTTALARYYERTRTLQPIAPVTRGRSSASPTRAST